LREGFYDGRDRLHVGKAPRRSSVGRDRISLNQFSEGANIGLAAVAFLGLLGILWHAGIVMLNDGIQRRRYHIGVRAIATLPANAQSAARDALMKRTRRRLSPFGRGFSIWWRRRHPGRSSGGRAWVSNRRVDAMALGELVAGCLLLISMAIWAVAGVTPIRIHAISLVGGTAGGVAGGLLCESAHLMVILLGHMVGAGVGAAGLVGIAGLASKL
jgi:hypothetical protein